MKPTYYTDVLLSGDAVDRERASTPRGDFTSYVKYLYGPRALDEQSLTAECRNLATKHRFTN